MCCFPTLSSCLSIQLEQHSILTAVLLTLFPVSNSLGLRAFCCQNSTGSVLSLGRPIKPVILGCLKNLTCPASFIFGVLAFLPCGQRVKAYHQYSFFFHLFPSPQYFEAKTLKARPCSALLVLRACRYCMYAWGSVYSPSPNTR